MIAAAFHVPLLFDSIADPAEGHIGGLFCELYPKALVAGWRGPSV